MGQKCLEVNIFLGEQFSGVKNVGGLSPGMECVRYGEPRTPLVYNEQFGENKAYLVFSSLVISF